MINSEHSNMDSEESPTLRTFWQLPAVEEGKSFSALCVATVRSLILQWMASYPRDDRGTVSFDTHIHIDIINLTKWNIYKHNIYVNIYNDIYLCNTLHILVSIRIRIIFGMVFMFLSA